MVSIALLTVSDTRDIKNDDSGQFLVDSLKIDKHHMSNRIICKDNIYIIRKYISDWIADNEIDVIVLQALQLERMIVKMSIQKLCKY